MFSIFIFEEELLLVMVLIGCVNVVNGLIEKVFKCVDEVLYELKYVGRNCVFGRFEVF